MTGAIFFEEYITAIKGISWYQHFWASSSDLVLVSTRSPDAIVQHLIDKTLENNTECMMTANLDDK